MPPEAGRADLINAGFCVDKARLVRKMGQDTTLPASLRNAAGAVAEHGLSVLLAAKGGLTPSPPFAENGAKRSFSAGSCPPGRA